MTENVKKVLIGSATFLDMELKALIEAAQTARQKLNEDSTALLVINLDDVNDEDAMTLHHTYSNVARKCRHLTDYLREKTETDD